MEDLTDIGEEDSKFYIGRPRNMFQMEDSESDMEDGDGEEKLIIIGICAMAKKCKSIPMEEILTRLERFEHLALHVFDEKVILEEPVENWPMCDCLISFHSKGFPLDKAVEYAELRKPMLINDLYMQYTLWDRRAVHQMLQEHDIDQPVYSVLDRSESSPQKQLIEQEDHVEVNNIVFHKPFVEKPISAEDHNVYIYFPTAAGGGSQRLFRKIGNKSSVYSPVGTVRKTGSYIYEEFMPTDGTDVKVYTVGPDYAHAEARKSPALDGKVERDKNGKEIRYPVILNAKEKIIARNISVWFKQTVCGFDLLRANGRSYVCDVNGFSFVKTSPKYYDDCAKILGNMVLRQLAPTLHIPYSITYQPEDIPIVPTTSGTMMELRCVVAVIRHGDRTPKQKMKMEVRHKKFFHIFEKYGGYKSGQLKLKRPKQLQEILDIARFLLTEVHKHADPELEDKKTKLEQLKAVLEMYGHFSGINRKVQLKYQPHGAPTRSSSDDEEDDERKPSLVLILKWGGELTPAGKIQAEKLGEAFRYIYPGGQGDYGTPGLGLLRLHSTFRHDLKIYASDEGRVQMTAAAFTKGLLALEGELPPILAQMVKSANMNGLLDNDNESAKYQNIFGETFHFRVNMAAKIVKEKLQAMLNQNKEFTEEDYEKLGPTNALSLVNAIRYISNPFKVCERLTELMLMLLDRIKLLMEERSSEGEPLYHGETWELMLRRWSKLLKDFETRKSQYKYDISKIPDIYDCIKYDLQHNQSILEIEFANELHGLSKAMADIVIPQEYGITREEKLLIGQCICTPLLRKITADLQRNMEEDSTRLDTRYSAGVSSPHRHVKTRLYFTSESHIHSLLTVLRYGGLFDTMKDEQWSRAMEHVEKISELNYMTQIVIMLYEDPRKDVSSDERFHVELHFSPGAQCWCSSVGSNCWCDSQRSTSSLGYRSQIQAQRVLNKEKRKEEIDMAKHRTFTSPGLLSELPLEEEASDTEKDCSGLKRDKYVSTAEAIEVVMDENTNMSLSPSIMKDHSTAQSLGNDTSKVVTFKLMEDSGANKSTVASNSRSDVANQEIQKEVISVDKMKIDKDLEKFEMSSSATFKAIEPNPSISPPPMPMDITGTPSSGRQRHHSAEDAESSSQYGRMRSSSFEDKEGKMKLVESGITALKSDSRSHSLGENVSQSPESNTNEKSHHSLLDIFSQVQLEKLGRRSKLISTKVISGSSSAPDLTEINSAGGVDGWGVPSIRPLETLHNALTLCQMEEFLQRMATSSTPTPVSSPSRGASTPVSCTPKTVTPLSSIALTGHGICGSSSSSGGPTSPSLISSPDDIMKRLKSLIDRTDYSSDSNLEPGDDSARTQSSSNMQISCSKEKT